MQGKKIYRKAFVVYISFIGVLLITLLPLSRIALDALTQQALKASQEVLTAGLTRLEGELDRIYQVASALYADPQMCTLASIHTCSLSPQKSEIKDILAINKKYNHLVSLLTLTDDVGIVLPNQVVVASGRIHMPGEAFYGTYLQADGLQTLPEWVQALRLSQGTYAFSQMSLSRYQQQADEYIVFSFPLPLTGNQTSFCYVLFSPDTLAQTLALRDILDNSTLTLHDVHSTLLIDQSARSSKIRESIRIEAVSPQYHLTARLHIRKDFFREMLSGYILFVVAFLIFYALAGITLALVYTHHNAKPLVKMLSAASAVCDVAQIQKNDAQDAYMYMETFIQKVDSRLRENHLALANQEVLIKENLLERMLRGQLSFSASRPFPGSYFPHFPLPCQMAILRIHSIDTLSAQALSDLQVRIRKIVAETVPCNSILHFTANFLVVLHPAEESACLRYNRLLTRLDHEIEYSIRIGVSNSFKSLDELPQVFTRLRLLLRFTHENTSLVEENAPSDPCAHSPEQQVAQFYELLTHVQRKPVMILLDNELAAFRRNGCNEETPVQQFFFVYRYALDQAARYANLSKQAFVLPSYDAGASLDALFDGIRFSANQIMDAIQARSSATTSDKEQKVLNIIAVHLSNPALSVDFMEECLHISDKALQRIMRNATGMTFYEYLHSQRMEKAQRMLTQTDLPISEVCTACGYLSLNSFYKAFQRTFSLAPNAMRQSARRQSVS
jgi:AraC-like DNA-binding protein